MVKLDIKPLSLNKAYRGRRFSTQELKDFKDTIVFKMLRPMKIPEGRLSVKYRFGVSQKNVDGDNLIKSFQDSLAEAYGFNDNLIFHWDVTKVITQKGKEFIEFSIKKCDD